jgi:hypothetical protein
MKKNTVLIVGVLGIGSIVAYEWWKKKQAGTTTTTTTTDSSGTGGNYLMPPTQSTMPATGTGTTQASSTGISPTVLQAVQAWANADKRAPVLAMANALNPTEYNGMYDIITNFWNKGVKVEQGTAQQVFWDALRKKYDPNHNVW